MQRLLILLAFWLVSASIFAQSITSVNPDTVFRGQTIVLSITGQGTGFSQTTQGSQGTGTSWLTRGIDAIVPVLNSVQSPTLLNSVYAIPGSAAVGYWDLHVMASSGELVLNDGVFLEAATNNDPSTTGIRNSLRVCPNPVSDHFTIDYSLPRKARVEICLTDLSGRLLYEVRKGSQGPGAHSSRIDLPGLPVRSSAFLVVLKVDDMAFAVKVSTAR